MGDFLEAPWLVSIPRAIVNRDPISDKVGGRDLHLKLCPDHMHHSKCVSVFISNLKTEVTRFIFFKKRLIFMILNYIYVYMYGHGGWGGILI